MQLLNNLNNFSSTHREFGRDDRRQNHNAIQQQLEPTSGLLGGIPSVVQNVPAGDEWASQQNQKEQKSFAILGSHALRGVQEGTDDFAEDAHKMNKWDVLYSGVFVHFTIDSYVWDHQYVIIG